MKTALCPAIFCALFAASSFANDPDNVMNIHATWRFSPDHRQATLEVWNTTNTVTLVVNPKLVFVRTGADAPKKAADQPKADGDLLEASVEYSGGPNPPAPASAKVEGGRLDVNPSGNRDIVYTLGDDAVAAIKGATAVAWRVRYHGRLVSEVCFNEKGLVTRRFESNRNIVFTYKYDDSGKVVDQAMSLPDDPELKASLAAEEKELLADLKDAGNNEQRRNIAIHCLIVFYTCKSLEFDKAENLQFIIRDRSNLFNLKMILALQAKTPGERNKKLQELIVEFPEKNKAFIQQLMIK